MNNDNDELFYEYFGDWFEIFKKDQIRPVTAKKYIEAQAAIKRLAPNLTLGKINRMKVQKLLTAYGKDHEIATCKGFFHMIRACLQNAQYDDLIVKDPTFKLKASSQKQHITTKAKYLEKNQAEKLAEVLSDSNTVASDMFDFDMRTGLRFAELLGLTPKDINDHVINIDKTWLYKKGKDAEFGDTKNSASHRQIVIDDQALADIDKYLDNCESDEPIFVKALSNEAGFEPTEAQKYKAIYHSTLNNKLARFCKKAEVPRIGIHGLRHTHASLLFSAGISILSISKRLGHANTTTTEKVYVHLIKDQQEKDNQKMLKALTALGTEKE